MLFASDMDGTFLESIHSASAVNMAALRRCADEGVPFVFATGRPSRWVRQVRGIDIGHSVAITSNGAALYDMQTRKTLISHGIDRELAATSCAAIREAVPGSTFIYEFGEYGICEPGTYTEDFSDLSMSVATEKEALSRTEPLVKFLIRHRELNTEQLFAAITPTLGDDLEATYSLMSDIGVVEVSASGVTKESMLAQYCASLHVAQEDVVAYGDMPNDLGMLLWAGQGFAMPTAHRLLDAHGIIRLDGDQPTAVGRSVTSILNQQS